MGRPGIPKEKILAAIEEMVAQGTRPTANLLAGELGGSHSTMTRVLHEWQDSQKAQKNNSLALVLPEKVAEVLSKIEVQMVDTLRCLAGSFWKVASSNAEAALMPEREAMARDRAVWKQWEGDMLESIDSLTAKADDLSDSALKAKEERDHALANYALACTTIGELNAEIRAHTATLAELLKVADSSSRLEVQLEFARGEIQALKAKCSEEPS